MNGLRSMAARAGMVPAWRAMRAVPVLMGGALALSACISVHTPDKPIVIELNINIKQEVVYRLSADAGKTIESNKDIF
ncbi:MAG TPA: YnbE family lipoprotein [Novosphingobium sp.]|nr:YnbE family lipoprotein [Novosphingobium sp.]